MKKSLFKALALTAAAAMLPTLLLSPCGKGTDASSSGTTASRPLSESSQASSDTSEAASSALVSSETVSSKETQSQISSRTSSKTSSRTSSSPSTSSATANIKVTEPVYDTKLELPIGLFAPQSQALFEKQRSAAFADMKKMGATLLLGTYPQITDKMLDWAQEAGMKVMIYDVNVEYMTPEDAVAYVNRFKDHPAYYGIQIADEPSIERMENMSAICRAILQEDPMHYLWVDLLPTYAGFNSERRL